ncbi:aromatic ring-hydroxylating dioxygenase subunit alpha [Mycolicibacterium sp. YH-1]|nr:aromatic ring-hydroxylating dioxygenase subunit alpha [Mycolicibacterium sp. YH-1]UNB52165.1 aromatic ring-hydroxylating dioxygenase subunit alpha [Mycolicibacterium sp. YH-1]
MLSPIEDKAPMSTQQPPFVIDDRAASSFRINREVFVSPDVLAQERAQIFDRCWLFVGHESEIPAPFDFRTRKVGGRPVIFTRDKQGDVQVLYNSCPHRGAEVCREDQGNKKIHTCFYHGWSFDSNGQCVLVPDQASYGEDFSRPGLRRPAKFESYRGFVFASFNDEIEDLATYLGDAKDWIDLLCDKSSEGLRVAQGTHEYSIRANWKLLVENSIDGYHAATTHPTYFEMLIASGVDLAKLMATVKNTSGGNRGCFDLGNGHSLVGGANLGIGMELGNPEAEAKVAANQARIIDEYGAVRGDQVNTWGGNMFIFPSLLLIWTDFGILIRTLQPINPDYLEVTGWELRIPEEGKEAGELRGQSYLAFWGPGGLATPDDVEALESCQRGFGTGAQSVWSDISRGMARDQAAMDDELQMRLFWRRWNELMTGEPAAPEPGGLSLPRPVDV